MATQKRTLFISYCWSDGSGYADDLQAQLSDYFEVRRDKTDIVACDDIFAFMSKIANCDYVVLVLTYRYVRSVNCMLEVAFLLEQPDWLEKVVVLVIDESIYTIDGKIEILSYWDQRVRMSCAQKKVAGVGAEIYEDEIRNLESITSCAERFLNGISRIKNPSQIAIVNELARKARDTKSYEESRRAIEGDAQKVLKYLQSRGSATIDEVSSELKLSKRYTQRLLYMLQAQGLLMLSRDSKTGSWEIKKKHDKVKNI